MINPFIGLGISIILVALVAYGTLTTGFLSNETNDRSSRMEERQKSMEQDQKQFQSDWLKRQQDENKFNNETEHQMITLQRNASVILKQQLNNEDNLDKLLREVRTNLTNHRIIANITYDNMFKLLNTSESTANQTNTLLKFLTDNFGAESGYLEKENFQYKQANDTYTGVQKLLNNGTDPQEQNKTEDIDQLLYQLLRNNNDSIIWQNRSMVK